MDKNTIIGLLLIAGILFTFTLVTEPEPVDEETKTEAVVEDDLDNNVVVVDSAESEVNIPIINLDSVPTNFSFNSLSGQAIFVLITMPLVSKIKYGYPQPCTVFCTNMPVK